MSSKRARLDVVGYQQEIHKLLSRTDYSLDQSKAAAVQIKLKGNYHKIDSELVSHIDFPQQITPLPGSEKWMLGACHSKGRVFLVVDASILNGGPMTIGGKLICLKSKDYAILAEINNDFSSNSSLLDIEKLTGLPVFPISEKYNSTS